MLLQEILEARYDLETCEEGQKAGALSRLNALLDDAIEGKPYSREQLVEALGDRFREFRKAKRREESRRQH